MVASANALLLRSHFGSLIRRRSGLALRNQRLKENLQVLRLPAAGPGYNAGYETDGQTICGATAATVAQHSRASDRARVETHALGDRTGAAAPERPKRAGDFSTASCVSEMGGTPPPLFAHSNAPRLGPHNIWYSGAIYRVRRTGFRLFVRGGGGSTRKRGSGEFKCFERPLPTRCCGGGGRAGEARLRKLKFNRSAASRDSQLDHAREDRMRARDRGGGIKP
jgi:hypothetical protein